MKTIISTDRLVIRQMIQEDYDSLKAIISDLKTMKYYPKPYDDLGVQRWLDWCIDSYDKYGFGLWALILDDKFIGDCGISIQNIDGAIVPEIGYHLNKNYWHHGYIREASQAVKEWFFTNTKYDEVFSYMNAKNIPSINVAINNGMSLRKKYYEDNVLHLVYSITREEYNQSLNNR